MNFYDFPDSLAMNETMPVEMNGYIHIYINEDKYTDTIYSSLMKEGYSYCCRQWRSYVLVTFTGCSNR